MKRKTLIWLVLFATLLVFYGCGEKDYTVDFTVDNNAFVGIFVILQKTESSSIDTSFINAGQELIVHVEMGEEGSIEDYILGLEELPFHSIEVQNENGNSMLCDENALPCWSRRNNNNSKEFGSVILQVAINSF